MPNPLDLGCVTHGTKAALPEDMYAAAVLPQLSVDPTPRARDLGLTPREHEVLRCLVGGQSYKQVAGELEISIGTVRTHIKRLYRKLDVHSVAEAVSRALREGIVTTSGHGCALCGCRVHAHA